jgi:putative membrane protein
MHFIINLLLSALILFAAAYIMPQVTIRNYGTAIVAALLIGVLNATIGFLLRLPLNIVTLGLVSFLVRLLITAVIIKLVDKLMSGFEVKGFMPAIVLAIIVALSGTVIDRIY